MTKNGYDKHFGKPLSKQEIDELKAQVLKEGVRISRPTIRRVVRVLARTLDEDYFGQVPTLLVTLKGAYIFAAELSLEMDQPHTMQFVSVSSYQGTSMSQQKPVINALGFRPKDLEGNPVILVEDVIDSGATIKALRDAYPIHSVCSLVCKGEKTAEMHNIKYYGFDVPKDQFIVGYGMDYGELFRNVPYITALKRLHLLPED